MKIPPISAKDLLKFLSTKGFFAARQKGSHIIMKKKISDRFIVTVVPLHKELDPGTLLAILKQTELTKEELEKYLS